MGVLSRDRGYDRSRILTEAARARAKGRRRRAIALYRRVLAVEPANVELHAKLAPLLAETGQGFDAWESFRRTADACLRDGSVDRALVVHREAARHLPRTIEVWLEMAGLQRGLGREPEAVQSLLEGRQQFRRRRHRPQAVHLLRRVREIEPWHPEATLDLARLLAASDQAHEALLLLQGLVERVEPARARSVHACRLRLFPTFAHAWQWLRAVAMRPAEERASTLALDRSGGGR